MARQEHVKKLSTIEDVIKKLDEVEEKAELRDRRVLWYVLVAVAAGVVSGAAQVHAWMVVVIGAIFLIIGLCGVKFHWNPH